MALAILFSPASMDAARYDAVIRQLDEAGEGAPAGRLYHAAYGDPDALRVFDVWDSQESFERFGRTLMPILAQAGVDPGQPDVLPIHNLLPGEPGARGEIAARFTPAKPMSAASYDEAMRRMDSAGEAFAGLGVHACYGGGDDLRVFDVWSSREAFEAFGERLVPLLAGLGIDPGQPEIIKIHNTIVGEGVAASVA